MTAYADGMRHELATKFSMDQIHILPIAWLSEEFGGEVRRTRVDTIGRLRYSKHLNAFDIAKLAFPYLQSCQGRLPSERLARLYQLFWAYKLYTIHKVRYTTADHVRGLHRVSKWVETQFMMGILRKMFRRSKYDYGYSSEDIVFAARKIAINPVRDSTN